MTDDPRFAPLDAETRSMLDMPSLWEKTEDYADRMVSTPRLMTINGESIEEGFNRILDPQMLREAADPLGFHILAPMGKLTTPHLRCWAFLKILNRDTPERALIDLKYATFTELLSVHEALDIVKNGRIRQVERENKRADD